MVLALTEGEVAQGVSAGHSDQARHARLAARGRADPRFDRQRLALAQGFGQAQGRTGVLSMVGACKVRPPEIQRAAALFSIERSSAGCRPLRS
ncbi:MAG: hypothetical protein R3F17_03730 [Planctomycetota bacterium]